jgi:hypothetical protein
MNIIPHENAVSTRPAIASFVRGPTRPASSSNDTGGCGAEVRRGRGVRVITGGGVGVAPNRADRVTTGGGVLVTTGGGVRITGGGVVRADVATALAATGVPAGGVSIPTPTFILKLLLPR